MAQRLAWPHSGQRAASRAGRLMPAGLGSPVTRAKLGGGRFARQCGSRRWLRTPGLASAQIRPACRETILCTRARPMPVPSNSLGACRRWKAPNSREACVMSNPAPWSATKYTGSSFVPGCAADPDQGLGLSRGELPGVAEQVGYRLRRETRVALGEQAIGNLDRGRTRRCAFAQVGLDRTRDGCQVHPFPFELDTRQASQREHGIHQVTHLTARPSRCAAGSACSPDRQSTGPPTRPACR